MTRHGGHVLRLAQQAVAVQVPCVEHGGGKRGHRDLRFRQGQRGVVVRIGQIEVPQQFLGHVFRVCWHGRIVERGGKIVFLLLRLRAAVVFRAVAVTVRVGVAVPGEVLLRPLVVGDIGRGDIDGEVVLPRDERQQEHRKDHRIIVAQRHEPGHDRVHAGQDLRGYAVFATEVRLHLREVMGPKSGGRVVGDAAARAEIQAGIVETRLDEPELKPLEHRVPANGQVLDIDFTAVRVAQVRVKTEAVELVEIRRRDEVEEG